MARKRRFSEDGQILIVVATAFFFVLVGAAAMTIDLGNGMLQQKRLQNITDAAAVAAAAELSRGSNSTAAIAVAKDVVSSNSNGAFTLPSGVGNSGTGLNLVNGIEINGGMVRVALQRQVNTYLAGVIGVRTLTVGAQSKAGMSYQGVLPLAVKRFSDGDTSQQIADRINPPNGDAYDYLLVAGSKPLSEWPTNLSNSAASDVLQQNGSAVPAANPADFGKGFCDQTVAGPVVPFTGRDALANVANGNDFHFWIAPDIRNITTVSPLYYNNVQALTSSQQVKNQEATYFVSGYPSNPPFVGQELAAFSGVNDSSTVSQIKQTYPRGTIVTAMVYDGTVFRKTDLRFTGTTVWSGNALPSNDASKRASFNLTLTGMNGFSEALDLSVKGPDHWNWLFEGGGENSTYHVPGPQSVTLKIWPDSTLAPINTTYSAVRTFQVTASNANRVKVLEVTVVAGNDNMFSLSSLEPYKAASQGSATQFDVAVIGENNYGSGSPNAHISSVGWDGSIPSDVSILSDSSVWTVVKKNKGASLSVPLSVGASASVGRYTLKVTVADDSNPSNRQDMWVTLEIIPPTTTTNITNTTGYVKVLGYANYQITYYNNNDSPGQKDSNTVYACAVSDIKDDPSVLIKGMTPRLLPWK